MVVVAERQLQLSIVVAVLTGRRLPEAIKCVQVLGVADTVPGPTGRVGQLATEAEVEEGGYGRLGASQGLSEVDGLPCTAGGRGRG